jgi:BirA family biotin operon repressor/biotin-[acetyl-CoA-carboxylase] ligase
LSSSADAEARTYGGVDTTTLARALGVPRVAAFDEVASTMDVAHALAADGAGAGTLVLAEAQTAGRGRAGRRWSSQPGAGIWLTLIERPSDAAAVEVLSLRLGLHAALAVHAFADDAVRLKWPNDLFVGDRKLAGVLVEARWQDARPAWVAIGLGMNVVAPDDQPQAVGLAEGVDRIDVLRALVPALRAAAETLGGLTASERAAYDARDLARGRRILAPAAGIVRGVTAGGELLVESDEGETRTYRHGSLIFASPGDVLAAG